ncbi:recombinase family protein [Evansella sp. AB-P1]|uniref:recombinase family protein n=1 Tax=Evansella sp. AB-P1 TaxID=3037653 RepID=UPI00241CC390|nr:recombinase family protein [Evansella sp. AB-P1]MDG5787809.1 recombinase family protein [Evansella sp. AB-P1]
MKCVIYIRVSTEEQVKEGFSIPAQRERLRAFCQSQGWEIVEEYIEEGKSAKDLERPNLKKLLKDIKRKEIDIVLVYRLDRLTRSVLDLYQLLKTFDKNNVAFKSATEVYDTSTAMGRLFITLVAALAQWERENLAERVKFGIEQMIDEGKKPGGHSPYGYYFDKDFNCTIIEKELDIVNKIFNWYIEGFGYRSIAKRLNNMGIKPRLAKEWNHNSIRDILMNDMYIGTYRWGSKMILNNHEPIISEPIFYKVQKVMESKTTNSSRIGKYPLTGILRCGSCTEHNMQGFFDKRDQKLYYRCLKCNKMTWDKRILEPLLDEIEKLITSKEYFLSKVETSNSSQVDIKEIIMQIESIQAQKEKWYDVFMDDKNPISKEVLFEKINNLNKKEDELQQQLYKLDVDDDSPEEKYEMIKRLKNFKEVYLNSSTEDQKYLLHKIFETVVMYRESGKNKPITINYTLK